jgi:hypothetical protein
MTPYHDFFSALQKLDEAGVQLKAVELFQQYLGIVGTEWVLQCHFVINNPTIRPDWQFDFPQTMWDNGETMSRLIFEDVFACWKRLCAKASIAN